MNEIKDLAKQITKSLQRADKAKFSENHKTLRIDQTEFQDPAILDNMRRLDVAIQKANMGKCILTGKISRSVDIQTVTFEDISNESLTFVIDKKSNNNFFYFFYLAGLKAAINSYDFVSSAKLVWVAEDFKEFATWKTQFVPWGVESRNEIPSWKGLKDPRKIIRDLTLDSGRVSLVPDDVSIWLLRDFDVSDSSSVITLWKDVGARKLAFVLPFEVSSSNDETSVVLKGERYVSVPFISTLANDLSGTYHPLSQCANWVYESRQESDAKHTFLNYHLALEWQTNQEWPEKETLYTALSNAKEAYRLHLNKSSKEFLKALSELKKYLQEQVDRVVQSTRSLIANLWRDFAIAAGVVTINFIEKSGSGKIDKADLNFLAYATSTFILLSLLITLTSNARFHWLAKEQRSLWRKKLYSFIEDENFKELVIKPISKGLVVYRIVASLISLTYIVIVWFLVKQLG